MGNFSEFIINLFRAIIAVGAIGLVLAVISFLITFIFELKNIREERSHLSGSAVGNALLVLHSFFEPGRKPQTEQVIRVKKRRTPVEKKIRGLSELDYESRFIKGYRRLYNKRYRRKKL